MTEPLLPLMVAGIEALAKADTPELLRLAETAARVERPDTAAERRAVQSQMRVFGQLLALTRRNLRLLRAACGQPAGYEGDERV